MRRQVAVEVRWDGGFRRQAAEVAGGEDRRLKQMLAAVVLDNATLKEMLGTKF